MIFARTQKGTGSGPSLWSRNGWTRWHVVVGLGLMALAAWITREAWSDIYHIALTDQEASHIFLVPVVFLWLGMPLLALLQLVLGSGAVPLLVKVTADVQGGERYG